MTIHFHYSIAILSAFQTIVLVKSQEALVQQPEYKQYDSKVNTEKHMNEIPSHQRAANFFRDELPGLLTPSNLLQKRNISVRHGATTSELRVTPNWPAKLGISELAELEERKIFEEKANTLRNKHEVGGWDYIPEFDPKQKTWRIIFGSESEIQRIREERREIENAIVRPAGRILTPEEEIAGYYIRRLKDYGAKNENIKVIHKETHSTITIESGRLTKLDDLEFKSMVRLLNGRAEEQMGAHNLQPVRDGKKLVFRISR